MNTMDFESRSEVDVRKVGSYAYASHPSTEIICLSFLFEDGQEADLWHPAFEDQTPLVAKTKAEQAIPARDLPRLPDPTELFERIERGELFEAHNAFFERCMWWFLCVQKMGWPKVKPEQWRCSAAKGSSYALPRKLEKVAKVLGCGEEKDMEGHRLMLKLCKPAGKTSLAFKAGQKWHQKVDELERVFAYCRQDVMTEHAVSQKLRPLPEIEQNTWLLDQRINARGVHIDRGLAMRALDVAEDYRLDAGERLSELTGGKITKHTQRGRMLEWLASRGVETEGSLNAETQKRLLEEVADDSEEHEALTLWHWANRTSTAKYNAMLTRMDPKDGRVRDTLMYHGASTGRWSGKGVQPQNFPRACPEDPAELSALCEAIISDEPLDRWGKNDMDAIVQALRGTITARPGCDLISADYAAVEARGTSWIAEHEAGLQQFRDLDAGLLPNQDVYTLMATSILGHTVTKDDKKDRQTWGKVPVLACGYQGGVHAIWNFAPDMEEELAEEVVEKYRSANQPVVDFWYATERHAIKAVRNPGQTIEQGPFLRWKVHGKFLFCRLPSGRCLAYYRPHLKTQMIHPRPTKKKPFPEPFEKVGLRFHGEIKTGVWGVCSTYGGKLTENIVQALCRDLMRDAMLRVEPAGYPIVLSVHDELVSEVRKGFGDLAEFEALMAQTEPWAASFPLIAEGWRGERYRK